MGAAILVAQTDRHFSTANTLRGDYRACAGDYTVQQDMAGYTADEQDIWRTLYRRQVGLLPRYAAGAFRQAVARLDMGERIPDFRRVNDKLARATGWQIVAVPGLIPDDAFFGHLAARRFPVSVWLRGRHELDYLVEPDLFHDFFGHVPLLFEPLFADYLAAYGIKGREALGHGALKQVSRLYWYMVEFGLIREQGELRAYGAGMLSSAAETQYSVEDPRPLRVRFDLARVMRSDYRIDDFQKTYFVIDSFEELFAATLRDFRPLYSALSASPAIPAGASVPGDGPVST